MSWWNTINQILIISRPAPSSAWSASPAPLSASRATDGLSRSCPQRSLQYDSSLRTSRTRSGWPLSSRPADEMWSGSPGWPHPSTAHWSRLEEIPCLPLPSWGLRISSWSLGWLALSSTRSPEPSTFVTLLYSDRCTPWISSSASRSHWLFCINWSLSSWCSCPGWSCWVDQFCAWLFLSSSSSGFHIFRRGPDSEVLFWRIPSFSASVWTGSDRNEPQLSGFCWLTYGFSGLPPSS